MPQNPFINGFAADYQAGADVAKTQMDRFRNMRAGYQAAPLIAQGNYGGAAQAYADQGLSDPAAVLMGKQAEVQQQGVLRDRQAKADETAAVQRRLEMMQNIAGRLAHVPQGQRKQALDAALPMLQGLGVDVSQFAGLDEAHLTDDQLRTFTDELDKQYQQIFRNSDTGEISGVTPAGQVKVLQAGTPKPTIIPNGAQAAVWNPQTRKYEVVVNNPKTFAPKKSAGASPGRGKVVPDDDVE